MPMALKLLWCHHPMVKGQGNVAATSPSPLSCVLGKQDIPLRDSSDGPRLGRLGHAEGLGAAAPYPLTSSVGTPDAQMVHVWDV